MIIVEIRYILANFLAGFLDTVLIMTISRNLPMFFNGKLFLLSLSLGRDRISIVAPKAHPQGRPFLTADRFHLRLMQMFPTNGICQTDVAEFNRQSNYEVEHIRDFIILHYHVTNRRDSAFWRDANSMEIPAALQHRIDLFRETGRVFRAPNELFSESSWIQVMLGQGIMPEQHHQSADLMGDKELAQFLDGIRKSVAQTVQQLPAHMAYVKRFCPAP